MGRYLEDQGRVGGDDGRESTSTVSVVRSAGELGLNKSNRIKVSFRNIRNAIEKGDRTFCPRES